LQKVVTSNALLNIANDVLARIFCNYLPVSDISDENWG